MTEIRHFVTHADHRYLPKALALHASLKRYHPAFVLWMVCTSPEAEVRLNELSDDTLRPVSLRVVEAAFPELLQAKLNRTMIEYYYTLSPAVTRWILEQSERGALVTYLDSDLLFFSSPERVFDAIGQSSIGITPHNPSFFLRHTRRGGEYNVGWVTFRNDDLGNACLRWWFDRCIEWCYQRYEDGKYADQGYLDSFPKLFDGVKILDDPGFNLAPWNLANYTITSEGDRVLVDGKPLVFFHFADFVQLSSWHYSVNTAGALIWLTPKLRRLIFRPYIDTIRELSPGGLPRGLRGYRFRDFLTARGPKQAARTLRNIFFMQYIFVFRTHTHYE